MKVGKSEAGSERLICVLPPVPRHLLMSCRRRPCLSTYVRSLPRGDILPLTRALADASSLVAESGEAIFRWPKVLTCTLERGMLASPFRTEVILLEKHLQHVNVNQNRCKGRRTVSSPDSELCWYPRHASFHSTRR